MVCHRTRFKPALLDKTIKEVISANLDKDMEFCEIEEPPENLGFLNDIPTEENRNCEYDLGYWENPYDTSLRINMNNEKASDKPHQLGPTVIFNGDRDRSSTPDWDETPLPDMGAFSTAKIRRKRDKRKIAKSMRNTVIDQKDGSITGVSGIKSENDIERKSKSNSATEMPLPNHGVFRTVIDRRNIDGSIPEEAKNAIKKELINLITYESWIPVPTTVIIGKNKVIQSLMMASEKYKSTGEFDKWKGRLAGRGDQLRDKYTGEISAPTMDMASFFLLICIANHLGLDMESLDIPSAYLNADLTDTVYMSIDKESANILIEVDHNYQSYQRSDGSILVQLKKSLYGLPQAGRNWYNEIHAHLKSNGYKPLVTDPFVLIKRDLENQVKFNVIGIYVDDIFTFGNCEVLNNELKDSLKVKYKVKQFNKNNISYLGLNIVNDVASGITSIDQIFHLKEMLKKYDIKINKNRKPIAAPSDEDFFKDPESTRVDVDQDLFRSKVMSLMYIAKRTRPDVLLEVTFLSTKCMKATKIDEEKLKRVMEYLAWNDEHKLYIKRKIDGDIILEVYCDASHMIHADCKGHTGVLIQFNENFILGISKKQPINSDSSCEAELIALHTGGHMATWLDNMLEELGMSKSKPITILQDNQATIKLANQGHGKFGRTKHIKRRYFAIKDLIDKGVIKLEFVPTGDMLADFFTKPLSVAKRRQLRAVMMGKEPAKRTEINRFINMLARYAINDKND